MAISPRKLRHDVYSYSYQNDSNTPLVISVLASLIERTLDRNEIINGSKRGSTISGSKIIRVFDCHERPDMSIQSYLERIFKYTKTGPSVYVVVYVYIDRFCLSQPEFRITGQNVHRLLITTILVASKYVEDIEKWAYRLHLQYGLLFNSKFLVQFKIIKRLATSVVLGCCNS